MQTVLTLTLRSAPPALSALSLQQAHPLATLLTQGVIKNVVWSQEAVREPSPYELLDRCVRDNVHPRVYAPPAASEPLQTYREPAPVFEPDDELITPPTRRRLSVQPEPGWPTVKGHASVPQHLDWSFEG